MTDRPKDDAFGGAGPAHTKLHKVTLYVRPDQIFKLEEIQLQERRRTGRRPDKSALIQEALDLLIERYTSTANNRSS